MFLSLLITAVGAQARAQEPAQPPATDSSATAAGPPVYYLYPTPPSELPFDGHYVPPGYHVESRARKGLIIGGAAPLGVLYSLGLQYAFHDSPELHLLAVPVVGPWLAMGLHKDPCDHDPRQEEDFCVDAAPIAYFFDGLGQVAGAILLTTGLLNPKQVLVPDGSTQSASSFSVTVVPWLGASRGGVGLGGNF